ncbi:hypothetical protein [Actinoplanes sp. NBRC 101535]|uniref:hypothetical protein n=1 Tax=Actinoplanes sp. NBRC 101535 TaxID=3032196 RepID=UPI0024A1CEEF|nr:hypothetical protein [Actinoplanes sp. NBRC 101535]GLY03733.1 hypothetical protein Acsp01_41120 [Actinoplanes sp. NBRC 101535]
MKNLWHEAVHGDGWRGLAASVGFFAVVGVVYVPLRWFTGGEEGLSTALWNITTLSALVTVIRLVGILASGRRRNDAP